MALAALMRQFVGRVQIMTTTADAAGGWNPVWRDVFAPVFARIEVASAARMEQFARQEMNVSHELFTATVGIRVGMRFLTQAGIPYLIQGVVTEPQTGGIQTYFHFLCEEQRPLIAN